MIYYFTTHQKITVNEIVKLIHEKIMQNIEALSKPYQKELLDFTFTLIEKQKRERKLQREATKEFSNRNQEILHQIELEKEEQKREEDLMRKVWQVRRSREE